MKRMLLSLFEGLFLKLTDYMGRSGFILYGGGGGGQTSTGVTYTSNIPEYAQQPFMNLVGKSEAISNQPYQAFGGQRIEGFNPTQQAAFQRANTQQVAPQIGMGSGLAAGAATSSFTQPGMANAYMSPFMQNVVDIQKREANRDAGIATTQRNAQAVKAGAFGGSRQAIMDAEAQRNLQTQLGDIQGKGLQAAFESGQGQFNAEMGRGIQGAQTLGQLGQQQFGQQMDITQLLGTTGAQQQQLGQKQLDQQYADFQAQRDYPYQQLGFLSDILRGTSGSTRTMYSSAPQASGLQTLAGLGTAAAGFGFKEGGLVDAVKYAEGGTVNAPQLTSQLAGMSDQMLQQYTKMHQEDPYTVSLALSEANRRKQMRAAATMPQGEQPQGTVLERAMQDMEDPMDGGIAAAVGEEDVAMAEGGIVGYADGGQTYPGLMQYEGTGDTVLPRTTGYEGMDFLDFLRAGGKDLAAWAERKGLTGDLANKVARNKSREQALEQSSRYGLGNEGRREPMAPTGIAAAVPPETTPMVEGPATGARMPQVAGSGGVGLRDSRSVRGGLGALAAAPGMPDLGLDAAEKAARGDIEAVTKAERDAAQADLTAYEKDVAARGLAGASKEKRIQEQQAGLENKQNDAKRNALIQAGLSILSADPSRGALAAIGEGALKGFGAYKGDIKDIEATREKLMDQMDTIEELRRQESIATGDEKRRLGSALRRADIEGAKAMSGLSQKLGLEIKPKFALEAWKETQQNYRTNQQIAASERNARIAAAGGSRNAQLEIMRALQADPALMKTYQTMNPGKAGFSMQDAYADYLKAFKPNPLDPNGQPMRMGDFQKMFDPTIGASPAGIDLSKWGKPVLATK